MKSYHFVDLTKLTWTTPMMALGFTMLLVVILQNFLPHQMKLLGFKTSPKEIEVDEDLPNFFNVIRLRQADEVIFESQNLKENYGFEIEDYRIVETLDYTKIPKRSMQGTPWYNILANPVYRDNFAYIGADVSEREKLIEDGNADDDDNVEQSDIVSVLLNLGSVPD